VLDRWNEFGTNGAELDEPDDDFLPASTFDRYSTGQGQSPPQENDTYIPPWQAGYTGFTLPADQGKRFAVKTDSNNNSTYSSGWFRAIRIPRLDGNTGGSVYRDNIEGCGGLPTTYWSPGKEECPDDIGNDDADYWATQGCYATEPGNMVGPTGQGVDTIIAQDPNAEWVGDGPTGYVDNSIHGEDWMESKRIVPIGVIDIDHFLQQDPNGANGVLKLVNIYGFFIECMGDIDEVTGVMSCGGNQKAVIGRVLTIPGTGAGRVQDNATFLRTIILVR
jgi:hypothetical protein